MQLSFSSDQVAEIVQAAESRGRAAQSISGIASLDTAQPGDLSFLANPKYKAQVSRTRATVVLLPRDYPGEPAAGQQYLLLDKPSVGLARLCARIAQALWPKPAPGIHPAAFVDPSARVAPSATIGPGCVVEAGATIGERCHLQAQVFVGRNAVVGQDCWLMPHVVVGGECILKDRVQLQPGVIIGSDGFGYEFVGGRHEKVPQIGRVLIENDVEIGANTTIDRARFAETRIGEGTKIDNLVQIAHNVTIGQHCIVCAQAGISGSTTLEDYVIVGGQAGLVGHIRVGTASKIDAQSGVNADLEPKSFVKGTPCLPYLLEQRVNVLRKDIPALFKRVNALEDQFKKASAASEDRAT